MLQQRREGERKEANCLPGKFSEFDERHDCRHSPNSLQNKPRNSHDCLKTETLEEAKEGTHPGYQIFRGKPWRPEAVN